MSDLDYHPKNESIRCMRWSFNKLKYSNVGKEVLITRLGHHHWKENHVEP